MLQAGLNWYVVDSVTNLLLMVPSYAQRWYLTFHIICRTVDEYSVHEFAHIGLHKTSSACRGYNSLSASFRVQVLGPFRLQCLLALRPQPYTRDPQIPGSEPRCLTSAC